jgi:hypothetical protein
LVARKALGYLELTTTLYQGNSRCDANAFAIASASPTVATVLSASARVCPSSFSEMVTVYPAVSLVKVA